METGVLVAASSVDVAYECGADVSMNQEAAHTGHTDACRVCHTGHAHGKLPMSLRYLRIDTTFTITTDLHEPRPLYIFFPLCSCRSYKITM